MSQTATPQRGLGQRKVRKTMPQTLMERARAAGGTLYLLDWTTFQKTAAALRKRFGGSTGVVSNRDGSRTHQVKIPDGASVLSFEYRTETTEGEFK